MSMHRAPARDPHPPASGRSASGRPTLGRHDETDWDVEDAEWLDDEPRPRILWGRLAAFAAALMLAFLFGRVTAGDDSAAQLEAARAQVGELNQQLDQARAEVQALRSGAGETSDAEAGAAAEGEAPEGAEGAAGAVPDAAAPGQAEAEQAAPEGAPEQAAGEGASAEDAPADGDAAASQAAGSETYTVQPGDNLFIVAERFYGDGQQWRRISEANGLEPGAVLAPGDTLQIPSND